jgi:hypothetical protein
MQLDDVRQSCFSAQTKSWMMLDLWSQLNLHPDRPESSEQELTELSAQHNYYQALGIVENLERMGERITPELAEEKELYLYRGFHFTAWLIGGHFDDPEMVVQMDDCSIDILRNPAIQCDSYVTDRRFRRWWVYPRDLIKNQHPPDPLTEDFLMNLEPRPVLFEAHHLLCILMDSSSTAWLKREVDYFLQRSKKSNA